MNIPSPGIIKKRVVIVGGGFGGLSLANKLDSKLFQVVLLDKNNYHIFQPLLYQVASSGLEAEAISFPFRNFLQKRKGFYFRLAEVKSIDPQNNSIITSIGRLSYDYLVIATGTTTNFFDNKNIIDNALPMKSIEEAMILQNTLLLNIEKSLTVNDPEQRLSLLNVVIVGGGATGVEIAGAISEMKRFVIPKDYPELKDSSLNIYVIEGSQILASMSDKASAKAKGFLEKMGVNLLIGKRVQDYKDGCVVLDDGNKIPTDTLIWVSGVISDKIDGFAEYQIGNNGRIIVDEFNLTKGLNNVYVIGDTCIQESESYPKGHPQVAPVAIQQGRNLARNLNHRIKEKSLTSFKYKNRGTLATVGRNRAVADLPRVKFNGFFAWLMWLFIHLHYILGVRNKIIVSLNWAWNYFNYSRSMHFIFFDPKKTKNKIVNTDEGKYKDTSSK